MILSNTEIQKAIDDGRLRITPEPVPRRPLAPGDKTPYDPTAVNLRLGKTILVPRTGPFSYNFENASGFAEFLARNSDTHQITRERPYELKKGRLVLGMTLEEVYLPYPKQGQVGLAARIEGKSSFARTGLVVHLTAPTIHNGFKAPITLELINFGEVSFTLFPEMYICQLILEEVRGIPFEYQSQFQDQTTPAGTRPGP